MSFELFIFHVGDELNILREVRRHLLAVICFYIAGESTTSRCLLHEGVKAAMLQTFGACAEIWRKWERRGGGLQQEFSVEMFGFFCHLRQSHGFVDISDVFRQPGTTTFRIIKHQSDLGRLRV